MAGTGDAFESSASMRALWESGNRLAPIESIDIEKKMKLKNRSLHAAGVGWALALVPGAVINYGLSRRRRRKGKPPRFPELFE